MDSAEVAESFFRVPSSDGFEVATWFARPQAPRGLVVLCHGLTTGADDDGPFIPLRNALLRRGLAVARFDARCHGLTGGTWEALSLRGWRDDIVAVTARCRAQIGTRPVALLATSFSGGPAVAAAARIAEIAGLLFWNPVLDYQATYLDPRYEAARQVLATIDDRSLPEWAAARTPWADAIFSHTVFDEFRSDRTIEELATIGAPTLIVHGSSDQFVPIDASARAAAVADRARLVRIPIARHGFRFFRPLVRTLTVRWLDQAIAGAARFS